MPGSIKASDDASAGQTAQWLCRQNIANFRSQLSREVNGARRATLSRLLAEEEERLRRLLMEDDADDADESARRARISDLVEMLGRESDGRQRTLLRSRLIEAEDEFGVISQRLDMADAYIADGERRIERQRMLVASLGRSGVSSQTHRQILENYEDLAKTFRSYRNVLVEAMDRTDL